MPGQRTKWDAIGEEALHEIMEWPRERLLAEVVSLRLDMERLREDMASLSSQLHYMDQTMPDPERKMR